MDKSPITTQPSLRQVGGEHYKKLAVQPWDVVDTWPTEQQIGYYRGGALKYLMRMGSKDESVQEVSKGQPSGLGDVTEGTCHEHRHSNRHTNCHQYQHDAENGTD